MQKTVPADFNIYRLSPLAPHRVRFAPQNRLFEPADCNFDNFTAKLIAADEYSKYMTEMPILEGVANREYYGRSATSIENKSPIEYGTEQGLAALIYGEQGVSSLPIQDIKGEYIDTDNEYMYYYSVEFVK